MPTGQTTQVLQQPDHRWPGLGQVVGQADAPPRTLHVSVPHEAWRRARSAALDSGLAFKDYMALLMLSARPILIHGDDQAAAALVNAEAKGQGTPSQEDGP